MALLDFNLVNRFAPEWKKILLKTQEALDIEPSFDALEWVSTPDPGIGEDVGYGMAQPIDSWQEPVYEAPAWDFSADLEASAQPQGIFSGVGDAFGGIQWGEPDPGIGAQIGQPFQNYWAEDLVTEPVLQWGMDNGATEDWLVSDRDWSLPEWDLPVPQFESEFRPNLMAAHEEDDPWADVVDLRGQAPVEPGVFGQIQPLAEPTTEWQLPDFGSTFRDIAGGFGSALTDTPDEYAWDAPNWTPAPTGVDTDFYYEQTPYTRAYMANELGMSGDFIDNIGGLSPDVAFRYTVKDLPTRSLSETLTEAGGALLNANEVVFNQLPQLGFDAVKEPIDSLGWANLLRPGPQTLIAALMNRDNLEVPLDDTTANIKASSSPWDFAEQQSQDYKDRNPWYTELAGQVVLNPGSGIWSKIDDLPDALKALDLAVDNAQGGQLLGALGDIPGAGTFAKNVVVPGAVGGGLGAATEIFDPTYTDPITGESYNPSLAESILGGTVAGVLGTQAYKRGLVPGQGIEFVDDGADDLVKDALARIDVHFAAREADAGAAQAALTKWQMGQFEAASKAASNNLEAQNLWRSLTDQQTMRTVGESPNFTPEQVVELKNAALANAEELDYGPFSRIEATRAIDMWVDPNLTPRPREMRTLRSLLAGEPYEKAIADSIDSEVDPSLQSWVNSADQIRSQRAGTAPAIQPSMLDDIPPIDHSMSVTTIRGTDAEIPPLGTTSEAPTMAFPEGWMGNDPLPAPFSNTTKPMTEWEQAIGARANEMPFPSDAPPAVTGANARPRSKEELEFIENLLPYVPAAERPRVLTEWEQIMGQPAKFVSEAEDSPAGLSLGAKTDEVRSKEVYEFIDSLSPYVPPEARERAVTQWDEVMGSGSRGTVPPLVTDTLAGRGIVESPDPQPLVPTDASTLPKPIAEFIDAGPTAQKAAQGIPWKDDYVEKVTTKLAGERDRVVREKHLVGEAENLERELAKTTNPTTAKELAGVALSDARKQLQKVEDELVESDIVDWRASAYEELSKMSAQLPTGITGAAKRAARKGRGALNIELADGLDRYGQKLQDLLMARKVPDEVARDIVEREQADYVENVFSEELARDPKSAFVSHLMTSLTQGQWSPKIAGVEIPEGTGNVAPWIRGGKTLSQKVKNQVFGLTDLAAIGLNAVPAVAEGGIGLTVGYANILLNLLGTGADMTKFRSMAPAYIKTGARQVQDVSNPEAGTIVGGLANIATDLGIPEKLVTPGRVTDKILTKWNELLSNAQYKTLMTDIIRKPMYEGNALAIQLVGSVTGKNYSINDVAVQRAAGNMADATTSAATLARGSTRKDMEAMLAGSAMFTRAQANVLVNLGKIVNGTGPERIVAASTIVSFIGALGLASTAAGNKIDLDPKKDGKWNKDFGKVTVFGSDGPLTFNVFNQTQVARVAAQSISALANLDEDAFYQAWADFLLGRTGPVPSQVLSAATGIGFDPKGGYQYPSFFGLAEGKGEGVGQSMSFLERALRAAPIPTNVSSYLMNMEDDDTPSIEATLAGITGFPAYDVDSFKKALMADGIESWDKMNVIQKREFLTRHPEIEAREGDTGVVKDLTNEKNAVTGKFEANELGEQVGTWRNNIEKLNNNISGAYKEMGVEPKEQPKEDGVDRWIYDFNQTFTKSYVDESGNPSALLNSEVLEQEQAKFWAEHPDPEVRKTITKYQLANKTTAAEKLYTEDMARLNGFEPTTGQPLTFPDTKEVIDPDMRNLIGQPVPNYFDMNRYEWNVIENDDSKEYLDRFEQWKQTLNPRLQKAERAELIKLYMNEVETTAPDGQPWNAIRRNDILNYGKESKESAEWKMWKHSYPELVAWTKPGLYWSTIQALHEE